MFQTTNQFWDYPKTKTLSISDPIPVPSQVPWAVDSPQAAPWASAASPTQPPAPEGRPWRRRLAPVGKGRAGRDGFQLQKVVIYPLAICYIAIHSY